MKRVLDLSIVFALLIPILPVLLIISILIKFSSRGPIFFIQRRIGKDMKEFDMYKFRTMIVNAEKIGTGLFSYQDDTRVTFLGKVLRKLSLDELPQLFSVLKGDMSLVGPRPALFNQHDLISLRTKAGVDKLLPGITGWAQVNGRDELSIADKVEFDKEYLNHKSFWFDMKILWMTLLKVFTRNNVSH